MTLHYRYGLLKPQRAPGAREHNGALLGPGTLGIEVTEPELAVGCGLGNVDPQHLGGNWDIAAIDAALSWPVPAADAKLVTIRPDADAFGAMAVLTLRAQGWALSEEARKRIALVSLADHFARGHWPGPRPLPVRADEIDEVGLGPQNLGALNAGLARPATLIEEGVREMMRWILTGAAPDSWIAQASMAAETLFAALQGGTVTVRDLIPGRIALVEGFAPGALRLGYRRAPVVVAVAILQAWTDRAPQRRITIAQYELGYFDLGKVARILSLTEPGWDGSATIIGSPQGAESKTAIERCVDVLRNADLQRLIPPGRGEHG